MSVCFVILVTLVRKSVAFREIPDGAVSELEEGS